MSEIREDLVLYDRFTEAFTRYIREIENASESTRRMRQIIDDLEGSQRRTASASSDLASSIRNLAGTYLSLRGMQSLFTLSDTIASTTARLDMMNDGLQDTEELNQMIYESAQRSRGLYTDTADFVSNLGNLAGEAFSSNAELIAFAEQINKQIAISGTAGQQAQAAMLQLTQGLSSGALRGEELNSVLENTPMIAQTIANYMGVTTGEMRELASEGQVTAAVVKNAMFAAAEETNAKFEEMPMTWAQVWNKMQNQAIQAIDPLLDAINQLANSQFIQNAINVGAAALSGLGYAAKFAADNIEIIGPLLATAAAAVLTYKISLGLAATAQAMLNAAMMANPVGIVIALFAVLAASVVWAWDTCEGFRNFWIDAVNEMAMEWMWFYNQIIVPVGNGIITVLNQTGLVIQDLAELMVNVFADAATAIVKNLDFLLGGIREAMEVYNQFAGAVGWKQINIDYALSTESIEQARQNALSSISQWGIPGGIQPIQPINEEEYVAAWQQAGEYASNFRISDFISGVLSELGDSVSDGLSGIYDAAAQSEIAKYLEDIADSTKGIRKSVDMSNEDIQSLVDVVERRYVANVNLTSQAPVINVNGQNTGNTAADRQALADAIQTVLLEQIPSTSVRATAMPT